MVSDSSDVLYELDPGSGAVLDSTPLPYGGYNGVAALGGLVYALNTYADDVVAFDPVTNGHIDPVVIRNHRVLPK